MGKPTNISPDSRVTYLLEVQIANQKKLLDEFARLNERFDRIEAYMELPTHDKKVEEEFITAKEAIRIYKMHRNTLHNNRKNGKLPWIKPGKEYLYRKDDIEKIGRNKEA